MCCLHYSTISENSSLNSNYATNLLIGGNDTPNDWPELLKSIYKCIGHYMDAVIAFNYVYIACMWSFYELISMVLIHAMFVLLYITVKRVCTLWFSLFYQWWPAQFLIRNSDWSCSLYRHLKQLLISILSSIAETQIRLQMTNEMFQHHAVDT